MEHQCKSCPPIITLKRMGRYRIISASAPQQHRPIEAVSLSCELSLKSLRHGHSESLRCPTCAAAGGTIETTLTSLPQYAPAALRLIYLSSSCFLNDPIDLKKKKGSFRRHQYEAFISAPQSTDRNCFVLLWLGSGRGGRS